MAKLKRIPLIAVVLALAFGAALYGHQWVGKHTVSVDLAEGTDQIVASEQPDPATASTTAAAVPELTSHVVAAGETLSSIASQYGTDTASLVSINNLASTTLRTGQTLKVLTVPGVVHKVTSGDTLWDISRAYQVALETILGANPGVSAAALQLGKDLIIPGGKTPVARTSTASRGASASSSRFIWPTAGHKINSGFGQRSDGFHAAIDIGVASGTTVKAAAAGTITYAGWASGYGYLVKIQHSGGYETRYGHNSRLLVKVGQQVTQGQAIAYSGNTGNSTGPHLHFEIRKNGTALNPLTLLP